MVLIRYEHRATDLLVDIIINKLLLFDLRDTNPKQSSFHHCTALFSLTSMPIVFAMHNLLSILPS